MKAILRTTHGPPETLQLAEVEKPTPAEHQILVRVHAASVNAMEWRGFAMPTLIGRIMSGSPRRPANPRLGADVAGTVEAVGSSVTAFQPGDAVFGVAPGSFAEYVCNGAAKFALKPDNVSFEAAAAVPVAGFTALQGLRNIRQVQPGQQVLIVGASGGVGLFAVQIAKAWGAEVTALCSTRNVDLVRSAGADHVIDYQREAFPQTGRQYDFILAVNGYHPLRAYRKALSPDGICVVAGGTLSQLFQAMLLGPLVSRFGSKKHAFMGIATTPQEDLLVLRELLATGRLTPVIDRRYPLSATAEAIRYVMQEHAQGKVVITVAADG